MILTFGPLYSSTIFFARATLSLIAIYSLHYFISLGVFIAVYFCDRYSRMPPQP